MDLTATTIPKSDQINAEDVLLSGPVTVTVESVSRGNAEQPVDIHLVEYPGRAYRPSKTMRRVLVKAWGAESDTYAGHRMTLYYDPDVRFGGTKVGGIKISHVSHIAKRLELALTETRGKRAVHTVDPLPDAPARPARTPAPNAPDKMHALKAAFDAAGITDRSDMLRYAAETVGRDITSATELTGDEVDTVIDSLKAITAQPEVEWPDVAGGAA